MGNFAPYYQISGQKRHMFIVKALCRFFNCNLHDKVHDFFHANLVNSLVGLATASYLLEVFYPSCLTNKITSVVRGFTD